METSKALENALKMIDSFVEIAKQGKVAEVSIGTFMRIASLHNVLSETKVAA